jgi:hypothetical protein
VTGGATGKNFKLIVHELEPVQLLGTETNGDAAVTLRAESNKHTQIWDTPLTNNRAVTLNAAFAKDGDMFRIIRTAASTGAFNLNVGTGPLIALATGHWAEVVYDVTAGAWRLSQYGALGASGASGSITTSGYTMATARMLGRTTAGVGAIEEMTAAAAKTFLDLSGTNSGDQFTAVTSSRLLGRYSAGFGPAQEISIGSGLTLDAGTGALSAAGSGPPTVTTVEVNIGPNPARSGSFGIAGVGLTPGKPVMIQQAAGPYTGKGTLADEAEMDQLTVTAVVTSTTLITAYYTSQYQVSGNFKFDYLVGA